MPHHTDIAGHAEAALLEGPDETDGHLVVVGDDARRAVAQPLGGDLLTAADGGQIGSGPADRELQFHGGLAQGAPPHAVRPGRFRSGQVGDAAVSQFAEVLGRPADAARVVGHHAGHILDGPVHDDQRLLLGHHPDRGIGHSGTGEHNPVDRWQRPFQRLAFPVFGLLGVGEKHGVPRLRGRRFRTTHHLRVHRVADVCDDQGDH